MSVHKDTATLHFHIENYESKLLRELHNDAQSGQSYDITLSAHGVHVQAHQSVLCAHSEYFKALLSGRWVLSSNTSHGTVSHDLSNSVCSGETLQILVEFMYTGKVRITKDNIEELLNTATHLLIQDLRQACSKYFVANLAPKNCVQIWCLADRYHLLDVEVICSAIATSRLQDYLLHRDDLLNTDTDFIAKVITDGLFDNVPNKVLLTFLTAWQKQQKLNELPECLRLYVFQRFVTNCNIIEGQKPALLSESLNKGDLVLPLSPVAKKTNGQLKKANSEVILAYAAPGESKSVFGYSGPSSIDLYMYLTRHNTWKFLSTYEQNTWDFLTRSDHVGFYGDMAVFDGGVKHRSALVDFRNKTFNTMTFPSCTASSRKMCCLQDELFLVEESRHNQQGTIKCSFYQYDSTSMNWTHLLQVDLNLILFGFEFSTSVFAYIMVPVKDEIFIWLQDQTSQCKGPFWLHFRRSEKDGGQYEVVAMERQPLSKDEVRILTPFSIRGWKHATFKLTTDEKKIYVHRRQSMTNSEITRDIFLIYDIALNTWSREDEKVTRLPRDSTLLPVLEHSGATTILPVNATNIQSFRNGCIYIIEKQCPFVTRMWGAHIEHGTWRQLTAPPIENIENLVHFNVVEMPENLSSTIGSPALYDGNDDNASHSLMLNWGFRSSTSENVPSHIRLQSVVAERFTMDEI